MDFVDKDSEIPLPGLTGPFVYGSSSTVAKCATSAQSLPLKNTGQATQGPALLRCTVRTSAKVVTWGRNRWLLGDDTGDFDLMENFYSGHGGRFKEVLTDVGGPSFVVIFQ